MKNLPKILITAGPTIEFIDPVRVISNLSTGHMGYEFAKEAKKRKHKTTLITGPVRISPPKGIKVIKIQTAKELQAKTRSELKKNDILIMASAVCDFKPSSFSKKKIKSKKLLSLRLKKNPDILKDLTKKERKDKVIVGFALESSNLVKNATKKMKDKALDLIVANKINKGNNPFGKGQKTVYVIGGLTKLKKLKNTSKAKIAAGVLDTVKELCYTPERYV